MNDRSGLTSDAAVPPDGQPLPDGARRPYRESQISSDFWKDVPAQSWLMNPANGRLHFRGHHPGVEAGSQASVHHEVLAGTLVRNLQRDGLQTVRALEVLPGPDGELHHFLIVGFPVSGIDGLSQPYLAGVAFDITSHKARVDELVHQALVDELTGLYNLRGFHLFAEHELKVARRRGTASAILYADVDGLKQINDTLGHEQGNAVLVEAAALLHRVFRECDVIARIGGDEFAVFAADVGEDTSHLRRRLDRAVAALRAEAGSSWSLSAGVGVLPPDPGLRLADLLAAADQAMYQVKFEKLERAAALR